jgi:hypothetical protein
VPDWVPTAVSSVETEITDKLLRATEAFGFSNRRHDRECDNHINAWNRHETRHAIVGQSSTGQVPFGGLKVLAESIKLARVTLDCQALIRREQLLAQPSAPLTRTQILMGSSGTGEHADRLHDVLQARGLLQILIAARDLPAQRLRLLVGAIQTSDRELLASSCASTAASILSVWIFAWAMIRTCLEWRLLSASHGDQ